MKTNSKLSKLIQIAIALVWLVNGLIFKLFSFAPRHTQIVSEILGKEYAAEITLFIGLLEILLAIWILSGIYKKAHAILQITVVLAMNIIEQLFVPDLLLWGRYNLLYAILFSALIYFNYFSLTNNSNKHYVINS